MIQKGDLVITPLKEIGLVLANPNNEYEYVKVGINNGHVNNYKYHSLELLTNPVKEAPDFNTVLNFCDFLKD